MAAPGSMFPQGDCQEMHPGRQELLKEVRCFVKGALQESNISNAAVAHSGLMLLKTLPSARGAVMEHLCNVFDAAVKVHLRQKEFNKPVPENAELEGVVDDVKDVILSCVKTSPSSWAPIISAWAVELLGDISSKYAERSGVPHSGLNETLQLWMTCPATKTLIDIASQCFSSMVGNTPDSCVDALLEASVKHSPHFDWVVAHIGSCFPMTIISRVLLCGLRDYCEHGESGKSRRKEPKVESVVNILGHLATRHRQDIRLSIMKLFKESLENESDEMMASVTPFLLHLASLSPMLLSIMSQDFVQTVTPDVMNRLVKQMSGRSNRTHDGNSLLDLTTHLVTQCESVSLPLLKFLLQISTTSEDQKLNPSICRTAKVIQDKVLYDLERVALTRKIGNVPMSPFLQGLQNHCAEICDLMLQTQGASAGWLQRMLTCISFQSSEATSAEILYSILERNTVPQKLSHFVEILHHCQGKYPDVLGVTVSMCVQKMVTYSDGNEKMLHNLIWLLKWESAGPSRWIGLRLQVHLVEQLDMVGQLLEKESLTSASLVLTLLTLVKVPVDMNMSKAIHLAQSYVAYFFKSMHLTDMPTKVDQCEKCSKLIKSLAELPAIRKTLLRLLLEESLSQKYGNLLGAEVSGESEGQGWKESQEFLTDNLKKGQAVADLRPRQGTLFHGGVIGQGLAPPNEVPPVPKDHQLANKSFLLQTVWSLCHTSGGNGQASPKICKSFCLLLIELITPDVMYNGIVWLEEDFCKVTVRRDLIISRKLDDYPILWDFLDIAASGSLYHCSAIMRSVTAMLISFWEGCREKMTSDCPKQLETTCKLVQTMRKGGMLLPPLCFIDEIIPFLPPYEASVILHDLWQFMHDKPPIPTYNGKNQAENALRLNGPKTYLDAIRNVLHSRIDTLGHLYTHFFPSEQPP